nr:DUF924 family protein [uncultured Sphingomonas sp.]
MNDPAHLADDVVRFWFDDVGEDRWFAKNEELDKEIGRRFAGARQQVLDSGAAGWRDNVKTLIAGIILLDQFSRNMFRGSARAFEADSLALELAFEALDKGWTWTAPEEWRAFLLMPLMHSEDPNVQARCLVEFKRLGNPLNLEFAIKHKAQIDDFGRFPGRNKALGRVSTSAERQVIDRGETF